MKRIEEKDIIDVSNIEGLYDVMPYVLLDEYNRLKGFKKCEYIDVRESFNETTQTKQTNYIFHLVGNLTTYYTYDEKYGWDTHRDFIINDIMKLIEEGKKIKSKMEIW